MEKLNETMSLEDIANRLQKTIDFNDSNLEDKDGTPIGFQFPKVIIEKLEEARFLCLLTDVYLKSFGEFFEGDISIATFLERLEKSKADLK